MPGTAYPSFPLGYKLSGLFVLCGCGCSAGDGFAHLGVAYNVLHVVIIHHAQLTVAEGGGYGLGNLSLGLYYLGAHTSDLRLVLLLLSNGHCASFLRLGLRYALIGFRLVYLQLRAHVAANVHVRNVYGQYFKGGARVKALIQHGLGYKVRIFKHVLMAGGRAYGGNYTFADTGDYGFLSRAADKPVYIGRQYFIGSRYMLDL